MSSGSYDVIIIGAGSVGTPIALYLAERGLTVLCIDREASAGQGNNKCAIGGARATHGEPAKVSVCLRSLEIFRTWKEERGDDIGWHQGGYVYVAYDQPTMDVFRRNVPVQKRAGLNIGMVSPDDLESLIPGINSRGLLGGTWSPEDGSASPMLSCYAFWKHAVARGAEFAFGETVTGILTEGDRIHAVKTGRSTYSCGAVVNCAGSFAAEVGRMAGLDLPIFPDSHEAGVTEPVKRLFDPMVVDIRKAPGSANYYFYQHETGQIVFCITPDPPIPGTSTSETSEFLPLVAPRMVDLMPRLGNLKVRRVWRGVYPMTPDGSPVVGRFGPQNHFAAVGMCGQGFMLGPGLGELMARLITGDPSPGDGEVLDELRLDRNFTSEETLK